MSGVIDFHSHILPEVDDGSKSLEMSLQMLRMMAKQGITQVVATPHFYAQHDTPERFLNRRAESEALLREAMAGERGLPTLTIGAEVYYFRGMSDSDVITELTIAGSKGIMIEMPGTPWTDSMYRELESLYVKHGLTPIIAHVDRYIGRFRKFGIPKRLAELPVLVQANANFFVERATSSTALRMLKSDNIHLLGSDCHNTKSRKPNLGDAVDVIKKHLGDEVMNRINRYEKSVLEY